MWTGVVTRGHTMRLMGAWVDSVWTLGHGVVSFSHPPSFRLLMRVRQVLFSWKAA